jgi:hypothetical protein
MSQISYHPTVIGCDTLTCNLQNLASSSVFVRIFCLAWEGIYSFKFCSRLRVKCDGTRAETRILLSVKGTRPFKTAGASIQSTTGSRGVRISGSNSGYIMFRESAKGTGYPLHPPVSPLLPLPCVTLCRHISTGLYKKSVTFCQWHCNSVAWPAKCFPGSICFL